MDTCLSESDSNDRYNVLDNIIEIIINPDSKFSKRLEFTILSSEILLDENLIEYRFVPVLLGTFPKDS